MHMNQRGNIRLNKSQVWGKRFWHIGDIIYDVGDIRMFVMLVTL